jgi:hypothetical protein
VTLSKTSSKTTAGTNDRAFSVTDQYKQQRKLLSEAKSNNTIHNSNNLKTIDVRVQRNQDS